ncbi:DUF6702 family protein [Mariniflexile soesokkakense]|uniref:DUF6702 family protein n=1 Tax=Mariniflexile soesokkakense TaxID=1343160 RepID=A0ABV0AFM6_9FLAO
MKNIKYILFIVLVFVGVWCVNAHAIKMTTGKLIFDTQHKTCVLTLNFFIDDFETELRKMYPQPPFNYENPGYEMEDTIYNYILDNVAIRFGEIKLKLKLNSITKIEDNVCQVSFKSEVPDIQNFDVFNIKNTLLFSSFNKQSNILHLYVNQEKRQIIRFFATAPIRTERI